MFFFFNAQLKGHFFLLQGKPIFGHVNIFSVEENGYHTFPDCKYQNLDITPTASFYQLVSKSHQNILTNLPLASLHWVHPLLGCHPLLSRLELSFN